MESPAKLKQKATLAIEIWLHVFSFLDFRSLAKAAEICRRWKSISGVPLLWKLLCLRHAVTVDHVPEASNELCVTDLLIRGFNRFGIPFESLQIY